MANNNSLLQSFHELVNNDAQRRSRACAALLKHLSESQAQFESIADVRGGGGAAAAMAVGGALGGRPCCNDLSYAVNRLLRGLSSSNLSSRQGFSVALAEVLIDFEPFVTTTAVVEGLLRETQTSNKGSSKSEQRDAVLGRIVGVSALIKAGRLDCKKNEEAAVHAAAFISEMITAAKKRSWLAPVAIENLCAILDKSTYRAWKSHLSSVVNPLIPSDASEWTASELAIAIAMDAVYSTWVPVHSGQKPKKSKSDAKTDSFDSAPTVPEAVKTLRNILASSTTTTSRLSSLSAASFSSSAGYPIVHPLWMRLFSRYQSLGVLRSYSDDAALSIKVGGSENAFAEFSNMWRVLVDESLCNSSALGKALSASLLTAIVPLACHSPQVVMSILSPNLVKLMTQ
jgi:hypothetical protein